MLTIKRGKDTRRVHALVNNLADLPDGITLCSADLVVGTPVKEGSIISIDSTTGLAKLLKTAVVYDTVGAADTTIKLVKGSHLKVNDVVLATVGSKAVTISAIDRDSSSVYDTITISSAIGAVTKGALLKQAASAGNTGALKFTPSAMLAEGYDVEGATNIFVAGVTIGQFKSALVEIDSDLKSALTNAGVFINFV